MFADLSCSSGLPAAIDILIRMTCAFKKSLLDYRPTDMDNSIPQMFVRTQHVATKNRTSSSSLSAARCNGQHIIVQRRASY